jgi:competence protein ComEC
MIGEYNGIDEKILTQMRVAGISHILSVSGMHLSLMAMICYFSSRIIINLLYRYTSKLHAKKIASIMALLGSFAYLLISGLQVAAIRSFIMVAMTILAVMFDRINSAMRAIFFAGLLILVISPQNILNPSFQMSFAAVIALIASYSYYIENFPMEDNIYSKIRLYFISTTFSSVIAGIATAPYVIYHFNQFSTYSVFANLLAVPLTSFIIMPCVILGFILYPLNLLKLALIPMSKAISAMIVIANYISTLPYASLTISHMSSISLGLISLGGLIYCLLKHKYRLIGIIPMILAVILMITEPRPIMIIDAKTKIFAYFNRNNQMILSSKKLGKFTKNLWLKYIGANEVRYYEGNSDLFYREGGYCYYMSGDNQLKFACDDKKYLHLTGEVELNTGKLNISDNFGTVFIYLKNGEIVEKSMVNKNRPW